ncbi:hypothetical protein [Janthinobacterium sp. RB2P8]|uniref:hypothetical protein n=1 Tax=Janthinobacterium sp. RB2P8 TaxID=3424191 RepID=UPI003F27C190
MAALHGLVVLVVLSSTARLALNAVSLAFKHQVRRPWRRCTVSSYWSYCLRPRALP